MKIVVKNKIIQHMSEQCGDLKSFANRLTRSLAGYIESDVNDIECQELFDDTATMLYQEGLLSECQDVYWFIMGKFEVRGRH